MWTRIALVIILSGIVLFLLGHEALVLLLSILLTYFILDNLLSKKIFKTIFLRIIIALFAYFTVLQTVIMTCWLFSHNFPLNYCLEVTFLLLIISVIWLKTVNDKQKKPVELSQSKLFDITDLYSVIAAGVILFLIMVGPIVKSWHTFDHHIQLSSVVTDYIDTSLDDSNHLSRVNDRLQLNRGVLYETNVTQYVVHGDSISTYPPAWHASNALAIKSFDPRIVVGGQSAIAYVITKLAWTFVMVYLFCQTVFTLAYKVVKKSGLKQTIINDIFVLGITIFLAYYTLLEQFQEGFYTFIPLIISLMLLVPLLMQLSIDKDSNRTNKYRSLLPLTLVAVNLTLSWFLLMPAIVLAIVISLVYSSKKLDIKKSLLSIWNEARLHLPILLFAFLGVIVQIIVIIAPSSQTFTVGVNTPGAIVVHSVAFFIFIGIGLFASLLLSKQFIQLMRYIALLLICMLGFSFFIYLFQIFTVHSAQYYYFKTLDAFIICAIPLAIIGWLSLLKFISDRFDNLTVVIIAIGTLIALPIVIGIQPPNDALFTYIHGSRSIDPREGAYIYDSISQRSKVPIQNRLADVIMYEPGDIGHNIVGTNILRSIQPVNHCDDLQFTDLLNDNTAALFQTISSCQVAQLTILTQSNSYTALVQEAQLYNLGSNIHIVSLN